MLVVPLWKIRLAARIQSKANRHGQEQMGAEDTSDRDRVTQILKQSHTDTTTNKAYTQSGGHPIKELNVKIAR